MPASWNASSNSVVRAFVRTSTACSSSGTPAAASSAIRAATSTPARASGAGPSASVASSVFSEPPSLGTSRFASSSTCGVER